MSKSFGSLTQNIAQMVTALNLVVNKVGDLTLLTTTADSDLVSAINEIQTIVDSANLASFVQQYSLDSAEALQIVQDNSLDSAETITLIGRHSVDSAETITLIDGRIDSDAFVDLTDSQDINGNKAFIGTLRVPVETTGSLPVRLVGRIAYNSDRNLLQQAGDSDWHDVGLGQTKKSLTTTSSSVIATYDGTEFDAIKLIISVKDSASNAKFFTELLIAHNGTTAYHTEYGRLATDSDLATFSVSLDSSDVISLSATPIRADVMNFTIKEIFI